MIDDASSEVAAEGPSPGSAQVPAPETVQAPVREIEQEPVPETGEDRVDSALGELADLAGRPPAEHVAIYEEVHRRLQDTLADLDNG